uniref:mitogen-activated protein kinase kinase kinase 20-like n=1 Tax=Erigeron canadensis TaxID=72917 RepID=UPI001CB8CACF|nr:mitogen-activated protein kinase kinase kinase 20-like [Erigeron canadensis]
MEFIKVKEIGHGSFSKVSLAKPIFQNSNFPSLVAVKSCGLSQFGFLMKERVILDELSGCPEIIKCYGDCFKVENREKLYNVVLEYACGGSLANRVMNSGQVFDECEIRDYTHSVLKGIRYFHEKGYVHCDIKLENILLSDNGDVKIADFGLAKRITEEKGSTFDIRGTPLYMAPETVKKGEQGQAADIWAFGCLVLEMFTRKPVWNISDVCGLFLKIGVGEEIPEIPGELSDAGKDFLSKCLVKDVRRRWTAEMLLGHPFVNGGKRWVSPSRSPRNPFDFSDWETEKSCWVTPCSRPEMKLEVGLWTRQEKRVSVSNRLRHLVNNERPNWSDIESWITIR